MAPVNTTQCCPEATTDAGESFMLFFKYLGIGFGAGLVSVIPMYIFLEFLLRATILASGTRRYIRTMYKITVINKKQYLIDEQKRKEHNKRVREERQARKRMMTKIQQVARAEKWSKESTDTALKEVRYESLNRISD